MIMKYILSILLLHSCFSFQKQNIIESDNSWNALIFLNQIEIPIYKEQNKKEILMFIKNDTINEDYYLIEVIKCHNNLAKIKAASGIREKEIIEGWMNVKDLGIYTRPRNEKGIVPIYQNSNANSLKSELITNEILNIIEIKDKWFKVAYFENDKWKSGWLSPENQCPNPYSTCN